MSQTKRIVFYCLLILCSLSFLGCGKKAEESKSPDEMKAEAEKMNVQQLKAEAMKYKDAIMAKQAEIGKIMTKIKEIPATKMLDEEAKGLQGEVVQLNEALSALKARFDVYYNKLKEKGGDLSGLDI